MPALAATKHTKDVGVYRYRYVGPLSFLDTRRFRHAARVILEATPRHDRGIVDGSGITDVDATAADMLADLVGEFEGRGAELVLEDLGPNVRAALSRARVLERLQPAVPEVLRRPATPASRQAA
jgi:MFS superfamily sulfate permease-like transporter